MAYTGFPATYQPQYVAPQYQQPYGGYQTQQPQQMMTPPTIRAEIIQIDGEAAVERYPLPAGVSQMFITRAEDKIIVKTMAQDGPLPLVVYTKRPPEPPKPELDLSRFITREEAETLISAAIGRIHPHGGEAQQ